MGRRERVSRGDPIKINFWTACARFVISFQKHSNHILKVEVIKLNQYSQLNVSLTEALLRTYVLMYNMCKYRVHIYAYQNENRKYMNKRTLR